MSYHQKTEQQVKGKYSYTETLQTTAQWEERAALYENVCGNCVSMCLQTVKGFANRLKIRISIPLKRGKPANS